MVEKVIQVNSAHSFMQQFHIAVSKILFQLLFRLLAEVAEKEMGAVHQPLFLRFINLLMNDAVFLLDEALSNMAKLKELQTAR